MRRPRAVKSRDDGFFFLTYQVGHAEFYFPESLFHDFEGDFGGKEAAAMS